MIDVYNSRLTERERRRQFVIDRKLINVRKQQALDRRRNPAERELYARLERQIDVFTVEQSPNWCILTGFDGRVPSNPVSLKLQRIAFRVRSPWFV